MQKKTKKYSQLNHLLFWLFILGLLLKAILIAVLIVKTSVVPLRVPSLFWNTLIFAGTILYTYKMLRYGLNKQSNWAYHSIITVEAFGLGILLIPAVVKSLRILSVLYGLCVILIAIYLRLKCGKKHRMLTKKSLRKQKWLLVSSVSSFGIFFSGLSLLFISLPTIVLIIYSLVYAFLLLVSILAWFALCIWLWRNRA